jgi:hypothetical protein
MQDVTARGFGKSKNMSGTRSVRKGFETFAPIGPWITTKDEIADPHNLWMKLWINGALKQSAKTDAMINDIATQISFLSEVTTLYPGDLLTTGNPDSPEFQEKLKPGDVLKSEIEGIGAMNQQRLDGQAQLLRHKERPLVKPLEFSVLSPRSFRKYKNGITFSYTILYPFNAIFGTIHDREIVGPNISSQSSSSESSIHCWAAVTTSSRSFAVQEFFWRALAWICARRSGG